MAGQHQVEVEAKDVPHWVVLALQEGVAALAHHVEEQHRALPRVERVGGPGKHIGWSGHWIPPRCSRPGGRGPARDWHFMRRHVDIKSWTLEASTSLMASGPASSAPVTCLALK